jgi:hypothetical protein
LSVSSVRWNDLSVHVVQGWEAILPYAPLLEQLAAECGQQTAMSGLKFILLGPGHRQKRRTLTLFLKPGADPKALREGDLLASVLNYELCPFGIRTGAYSTNDRSATRTVIAPVGEHGHVAAAASEVLLKRGAHIVLTAHLRSNAEELTPGIYLSKPGLVWGDQHHTHRQQMTLADTFEGTLGMLGKKTRFHMRYYRRRLEELFELEFVEDIRTVMSEAEFTEMNLKSRYVPTVEECANRWRFPEERGGLLVGLRTKQGEWLSIVGGWRQDGVMMLDFQVNTEAYPKESVSSVMRSYLLETEIARGTRFFSIIDGSPHSMVNSFAEVHSNSLCVYRKSFGYRVLRRLAKLAVNRRTGSIKRFAKILLDDTREWHTVPASLPMPRVSPVVTQGDGGAEFSLSRSEGRVMQGS